MKYIAWTVLGLVLLAAICGIVLRANMATAKLTVHAVRPMGTNMISMSYPGHEPGWPMWAVGVTNTGDVTAYWRIALAFKDPKGVVSNGSRVQGDLHQYALPPRQGVLTLIEAPPDSNVVWAVEAKYVGQMGSLERKLSSRFKRVPKLSGLLPNENIRIARDAWHAGTNVTTAH